MTVVGGFGSMKAGRERDRHRERERDALFCPNQSK
jgi:hypothetical protein